MAYVVTQSCCADASCVLACPVNCIHPAPGEPGFAETEMLYVDPATCVDCGACATACPADAIKPHTALTPAEQPFLALNAEYYDAFLADMRLARPDDYDFVVAQYDGEISQVDAQIGRLLAGLRACRRWENTIVLLVSDHGECFGEGGLHFDHHGLYDAVTRVAMILRLPAVPPARVSALVSHEDVLSTLCEAANLPRPPYELTGRSMLARWRRSAFAAAWWPGSVIV